MMTKKQFLVFLNYFKQCKKMEEDVIDNLEKVFPYTFRANLEIKPMVFLKSCYLDLLKTVMNDKFGYIEYFIYELDFGQKWKNGMCIDEKGNDIKLQTGEDLYNLLMET